MNIKLKGSLRTESLTLNVLLTVGIIAFFISLAIEVPLQKWMCYSTYYKLHLDYMSNVMLGIAASSVISYVSLRFSFINKKNNQMNSVLLTLKEIYKNYKFLYNLVYYKASNNEKEENYYLEKSILEQAKKLEKAISNVSTIYDNSEFSSETIDQIMKTLQYEITFNLSYITTFCEVLLLDLTYSSKAREQSSKYQNSPLSASLTNEHIQAGDIPRNIITKRAESEYYQFLLETINSNFPVDKVDTLFKSLRIEFRFRDVATTLNELVDATHGFFNMKNQVATQIRIRTGIIQIRDKHQQEYFSEYLKMSNRMHVAMEKINNKPENTQYFRQKHSQFMELLREDRLKEAEKILLEVENGVSSE